MQWTEAVKTGKATRPAVKPRTAAASAAPSLTDVMAFSGPGPEVINGRLAMLGFVAAVAAEFASGEFRIIPHGISRCHTKTMAEYVISVIGQHASNLQTL